MASCGKPAPPSISQPSRGSLCPPAMTLAPAKPPMVPGLAPRPPHLPGQAGTQARHVARGANQGDRFQPSPLDRHSRNKRKPNPNPKRTRGCPGRRTPLYSHLCISGRFRQLRRPADKRSLQATKGQNKDKITPRPQPRMLFMAVSSRKEPPCSDRTCG